MPLVTLLLRLQRELVLGKQGAMSRRLETFITAVMAKRGMRTGSSGIFSDLK